MLRLKYSVIKSLIEKSEKICFEFSSRRDSHLYQAIYRDKTGTKTSRMEGKMKSNFWKSIRDPFNPYARKYHTKSYKMMERNYAILRLFVFIFPYGGIFEEIEVVRKFTIFQDHNIRIPRMLNSKFY